MSVTSRNTPSIVDMEHCGWLLQAHSFSSITGTAEGWVCYVTAPESSHKLNIGRWGTSDEALEHGRKYVDRRLDPRNRAAVKPSGAPPRGRGIGR